MKLLQQQQTTGPSPEAVATTCPGAIAATKKLLRLVLKHLLQQKKLLGLALKLKQPQHTDLTFHILFMFHSLLSIILARLCMQGYLVCP